MESKLDNCIHCNESSYKKCDECLRIIVQQLEVQLRRKKHYKTGTAKDIKDFGKFKKTKRKEVSKK